MKNIVNDEKYYKWRKIFWKVGKYCKYFENDVMMKSIKNDGKSQKCSDDCMRLKSKKAAAEFQRPWQKSHNLAISISLLLVIVYEHPSHNLMNQESNPS